MKKDVKKTTYASFPKVRREIMRNNEFKRAYEDIQPKYAVIRAILNARMKRGLTQAQLARRVGTTQSAIARFESGGGNPTLDFLSKVSYVLGKRIHVIMK